MIRSELAARLQMLNLQLRTKDCDAAVRAVFDTIADALIRGDRVELRDFGVFSVKSRDARTAHNPRSHAQISVRAKNVVAFKPGKGMRKRLGGLRTVNA